MRLEPTSKSDHLIHIQVQVNARLVTSSRILHLSAEELEQAISQEQAENPALEVHESLICLFCGTPLYSQSCTTCGRFVQPARAMSESSTTYEAATGSQWGEQQAPYEIYRPDETTTTNDDDDLEPLASIPTAQTLAEILLQQLEAQVSADDVSIAEQLVGNLNEHGYLEISLNEVAEHLQVPLKRVEYVLSQLQTLEPPGIGARDLRECLLIQLAAISEREEAHPLAYVLIDRYLNELGHEHFHEIARELRVSEQEIRLASLYIGNTLHPFPAYTYWAESSYTHRAADAGYVHPDIVIHKGETGFEVELIEERRYRFRISTGYDTQPLQLESGPATEEIRRYMRQSSDQAKLFVDCIQHRWHTLKRVAELVVDYQRESLEKGVRYLRPLTRVEIALRLGLDESTVSRAIANKYALLPNGRLMSMSDFFDSSLGIKDILRELIMTGKPKPHLSDEELARLMTARGIPMARRTVTKYRKEMGIGSSRER
jgi:RNA polymerase sigma-54 factor